MRALRQPRLPPAIGTVVMTGISAATVADRTQINATGLPRHQWI
jgi:hypothetical protein